VQCVGELQVTEIWSNLAILEYNFEFQNSVEGESNDFYYYFFPFLLSSHSGFQKITFFNVTPNVHHHCTKVI
jgi:hypothetical protein